MKVVAFDIDGTIIDYKGQTRNNVVDLIKFFNDIGCKVYVWTGGGMDRAVQIVENLGLKGIATPAVKNTIGKVDVAFDDMDVSLADINIKIWNGF